MSREHNVIFWKKKNIKNVSLSSCCCKTLKILYCTSYLFVYFGPTFDLGHNHSHDASSVGGSEGEELLVGGDVLIP